MMKSPYRPDLNSSGLSCDRSGHLFLNGSTSLFMSRPQYVPELPLLLAGVPPTIEQRLRLAGVPVKRFRVSAFIAEDTQSAAGRFVIYDSKNSAAQSEAKTAKFYGLTTIDIADLLMKVDDTDQKDVSPALPHSVGSKFLTRLKKRIEKLGGLWIRLSDYPFPFQSVLCEGEIPVQGTTSRWAEMWANLPVTSRSTALTWQPCYDEFARWWDIREKISIRVRKQDACYHIGSDSELLKFRPALEIWRGTHVASIPMESTDVTVREDGLVFRQQDEKYSAGLAALWFESIPQKQPDKNGQQLKLNQRRVKTA